ncbi:MAG: hypothetical protein KH138_09335 [Firmicutes bacterium]|nr:hypothetical protein [Bacillota bacterium]
MKKKTTYFDEIVYYKLLEAEQEAEEVSLRYSSEDVYTAMKKAIEDRPIATFDKIC